MNKIDLSVPIQRANTIVFYFGIPIVVFQYTFYSGLHNGENTQTTGSLFLFLAIVLAGIVVHEFIHGLTWMILGRKPFSTIKLGFHRMALTPYAHLSEPIEVNAYKIGAIMPGIILGIIPYILSLRLGNGNLLWFSQSPPDSCRWRLADFVAPPQGQAWNAGGGSSNPGWLLCLRIKLIM